MFDEGGARHGIKTTNFTEAYNAVLGGASLSSFCTVQSSTFMTATKQCMQLQV
jgi:uncharacterized protein YccT (UPF0319 family)